MPSRRTFLKTSAALASAALLPRRSFAQTSQPAPTFAKGPFTPDWPSLTTHNIPTWYTDARFGISMHWGLYAVPAHQSEWYCKHMYGDAAISKWHAEYFGPQDKFGYKDFMPLFTCAKWDPEEWAQIFKDSGAKYVMPTHEHHDGFAMWDSKTNRFNAKNFGPRRDLMGELCVAIRKAGLKFGACDHSMEHYNWITPLPDLKTDVNDPDWKDYYSVAGRTPERRKLFEQAWLTKQIELIDKHQLDTLWWDNGANGRNLDYLKLQIEAHLYNRGLEWKKDVAMVTKGECSQGGHVEDYERQQRGSTTIQARTFEVHDSPGSRWCYLTDDKLWPSFDIIWRIVENTSKNGNLLFNIGPKPDGTIGDDYKRLLSDAGKWLKVNGEAIYASRPFTVFGEGKSLNNNPKYTPEDIRFTTNANTLYAIFLAWPGAEGLITSLAPAKAPKGKIAKVEMLGHDAPLAFTQTDAGLKVAFPADKPCDFAYTLKITGLTLS